MKDKRTYINKKEHGEDMSHENESKIDTSPIELLTEQYRSQLKQYQERESLYLKTENQLKGTKQRRLIVGVFGGRLSEGVDYHGGLLDAVACIGIPNPILGLSINSLGKYRYNI